MVQKCKECGHEIFQNEIIFIMDEVYDHTNYYIHKDCLLANLMRNKSAVMDFLVDEHYILEKCLAEHIPQILAEGIYEKLH